MLIVTKPYINLHLYKSNICIDKYNIQLLYCSWQLRIVMGVREAVCLGKILVKQISCIQGWCMHAKLITCSKTTLVMSLTTTYLNSVTDNLFFVQH